VFPQELVTARRFDGRRCSVFGGEVIVAGAEIRRFS